MTQLLSRRWVVPHALVDQRILLLLEHLGANGHRNLDPLVPALLAPCRRAQFKHLLGLRGELTSRQYDQCPESGDEARADVANHWKGICERFTGTGCGSHK